MSADRSVSKIERRLVEIGATNVSKQYDGGILVAVSFIILHAGNSVAFRLPARVDAVKAVLRRDVVRPRPDTYKRIDGQAERTAWKIISDWVDVQASMILLEQAEMLQVFLPYAMISPTETVYEKMKAGNFNLLNAPKP